MKDLFRKLFLSGSWQMAYRVRDEHWPFCYDQPFIPIPNHLDYWFADPFLVETNGNVFLFCEAYNQKKEKGEIAVMAWENEGWTAPQIIINENYHLSYPCVFLYGNQFFMIPESAECEALDLYVADRFPFVWHKASRLIEHISLADPTVFEWDDHYYLYAWDETDRLYKGRIYELDMERLDCREVQTLPFVENIGRPAGWPLWDKELMIRPSQDCRRMYGAGILWNQLTKTEDGFEEKTMGQLNVEDVNIISCVGKKRIHTYTTSKHLEVIDYSQFRFDLLKRWRILKHKQMVAKRHDN